MPPKPRSLGDDLRQAFAAEAESVLRCLFFARRADVEGRADIAGTLRSIADGEISQAFGHLELLEETGGEPSGGGDAAGDLASVLAAEEQNVQRYQQLAAAARRAGEVDAADWFGSLAAAEAVHVTVLRRAVTEGESL